MVNLTRRGFLGASISAAVVAAVPLPKPKPLSGIFLTEDGLFGFHDGELSFARSSSTGDMVFRGTLNAGTIAVHSNDGRPPTRYEFAFE